MLVLGDRSDDEAEANRPFRNRSSCPDGLFEGEEPVLHLMGWVGRSLGRGRFVDGSGSAGIKSPTAPCHERRS
jgi:hypothetical protein